MRTVPVRDLKYEMKSIVEGVTGGEAVLISHRGDPVAVLLPVDKAKLAEYLVDQAPPVVADGAA